MTLDAALQNRLDRAWAGFAAGAGKGRSRFSMVQAATIGLDGAPKLRTVVLRRAEPSRRLLSFNTDRRSPKAEEILRDPRISVLGYDMEAGLQIRAEGLAQLHLDGPAHEAGWAAALPRSRICYRSRFGPGSEIAAPEMGDPTPEAAAPDDLDWGKDVFSLVEVEVTRIDYLDLAATGHRRAVFSWDGASWGGGWVAP